MATTSYKDNAGNVHEFQQEGGDAGGAEKRPVTGLPAQVRTQFANMAAALISLSGAVLDGVLKVTLQAGSAVIGKLGANPGVNIGTVDVASGTFAVTGSLPTGPNHIGSVAIDTALPAGANTIGKVDAISLPALPQLPATLGDKPSASSLSVVMATDHSARPVSITTQLPAGNNNIGDVDIASMPSLPAGTNAIGKLAPNVGVNIGAVDIVNALQLPPSLGSRNSATSLGVVIATDQNPIAVKDGGTALAVQGSVVVTSGLVTVSNTVPVVIGTSLPAGNNNIGDVDIASSLPAGTNAIGKLAPNAGVNIGTVDVASGTVTVGGSLPAGNANIGDVDVLTLPPLPAGTNTIGKLGANAGVNIGTVGLPALPQLPATLGQLPASQSLSVAIANGSPLPAQYGRMDVVPASTATVTLVASNIDRVGLIVVNNKTSTSTLYLRFGTGASSTNWSVMIEPGGYWEMPPHYFTGIVTGAWGNTVGDAHVTETDNANNS